jgi:hypothetical protein
MPEVRPCNRASVQDLTPEVPAAAEQRVQIARPRALLQDLTLKFLSGVPSEFRNASVQDLTRNSHDLIPKLGIRVRRRPLDAGRDSPRKLVPVVRAATFPAWLAREYLLWRT